VASHDDRRCFENYSHTVNIRSPVITPHARYRDHGIRVPTAFGWISARSQFTFYDPIRDCRKTHRRRSESRDRRPLETA